MKKIFLLCFILVCSLFANKELKILNWPEYIDVEMIKEFTSSTGVVINYEIYDNNEELIAKLKTDQQYDVIFPSASYLSKMIEQNLLSSIDTTKLKNYNQIDTFYLDAKFKNYSIPYTWGTTSIIYNKDKITLNSFKSLWDKKLKDKLFILNDMSDMFAISLNTLNLNINTQNEDEIKQAYMKLLELVPNIKGFYLNSEKLTIDFINENGYAAIVYNGDVSNIIKNKKYKYIYPKEGALLWVDTIAISAGSINKNEAYRFIDFIISKEKSLQNFKMIGYAIPNKNLKYNSAIYPSKKEKNNLKRVIIGKQEELYSKYWKMFLTQLSLKGVDYE